MKLMAIPEEVREYKKNFLSRVFIKQQVELNKNSENKLTYLPLPIPENREEIIYRKNGKTVDKIHEFDFATNAKVKTTHFDYFNDKKIRSIDEFDIETGKILTTASFVLYKSVDEFDLSSGKKLKTTNYNIKDENIISSVQEYNLENEKIEKVYIYRKDGINLSIIKEINPETEKVVKWTSFKESTGKVNSVSEYDINSSKPVRTTYYYDDGTTVKDVHQYNQDGNLILTSHHDRLDENSVKQLFPKTSFCDLKELDEQTKQNMAKLIDNLFKKNSPNFESINNEMRINV